MSPGDNWGSLINSDKSPAPLLEHLCLGIAQLIGTFESDCGTSDLTPDRLASFYQEVGGNYDTLFLDTKGPALSFIYQSLGCFHNLQPTTNCFEPPSIPALLPSGFVRWQTIQLLLDPDEHSQYLQHAVAQWDIIHPDGSTFPKSIPRDAFPSEPDSEMVKWHEEVSRRLEYDYWKRNTPRPSPSFGAHSNHASPGDTLPNEGYFSRGHYRTHDDAHSPRRNRDRRRNAGEYPSRKVHSAFFARPEGHRPGFASPRAPSPPPWPDRHSKPGKRRTSKFPFSFGTESDASSEESGSGHNHPGKRYGRRNLGVSEERRARPHSHEAYSRKPRDISPDYTRRNSCRYPHPRHSKRHGADRMPKPHADELPQRPVNVRFREFAFDPAAMGAEHAHPHHLYARPASNYVPRRAEADDARRASYSSSHGPSSGSSSERTRSFTPAGHPAPKWTNPTYSPRCVPVCVADNVMYTPGRPGMHER